MLELPLEFQEQMKEMLGEEYLEFSKSLEQKPKTTIRINPNKNNPDATHHPLIRGIKCSQDIEWCKYCYTLESRPEFVLDPLYHAGCYYPQESSSMFIAQFLQDLDLTKPLKVLDLCAAPGGKSTLLLSYLPKDSLLVSNEIDPIRARILKDNLIRFGSSNCVVTNNKPEDFESFQEFFDIILVDAPCSGEGMMSKEAEAIRQWSPELVASCARTQKKIVSDIWGCLKVDGRLIYSTCTYNRQENEDVVDSILKNFKSNMMHFNSQHSPLDDCHSRLDRESPTTDHEVLTTENNPNASHHPFITGVYDIKQFLPNQFHFFPHLTNGLGFFAACIIKLESDEKQPPSLSGSTPSQVAFSGTRKAKTRKDPLYFKPFLPNPEFRLNERLYDTVSKDNVLCNIPKMWKSEIVELMKALRVIKVGIEIGQWKGPDWFPSHELALCYKFENNNSPYNNCHTELVSGSPTTENKTSNTTIQKIELNYDQAIQYLKKESIDFEEIPSQAENDKIFAESNKKNSWTLAIFQNQNLGWFKVIQGKPKNYLPTDWRIRQN